jgi:long-chain acyl-CoA synthetase
LLPNVRLFITYGSTEATGSAHFEFSKYAPKPNCVGIENVNSKIVFVDDSGNLIGRATPDNPGIVATEGDTVMLGYWKDPELTAKYLINGKLISADLGYRDENGFIYVVGRRDDVIISGGNKISPFEIEDAVIELDDVKECACIPIPDKIYGMGSVPKLFVVMKTGREFSQNEILRHLFEKLELFKLPRVIEQIDALPRTEGVGKISRKNLIKMSEEKQNG